ncbi:MAG: transcription-repair coupling factor [Thermanaeromonas sp.]|uniref:transcription-repair coupling factor n=1 Tax=Thermanaeromonas sp. TaxID=2003697 RepID=UPI00243A0319|nr:transcription-repair coupling factor [Thermanaeromonas sp.]MCG0277887.1 transcription-repair coupling factor [Thermanaeromonas sp.]
MYNHGLLKIVRDSAQFHNLAEGLRQGLAEQQLYDIPDGLKSLWVTAMVAQFQPLLVITATADDAQRLAADVDAFWPGEGIEYLPAGELLPIGVHAYSPDIPAQRIRVLSNLLQGKARVVVMGVEALAGKLPPPELFRARILTLKVGDSVDREALLERLIFLGYRREEVVEAPGHLAVRGGIIDIYPLGAEQPVRLEFFGDEIDSLRSFDPATQRSVEELKEAVITPAREMVAPDEREPGLKRLEEEYFKTLERLKRGRSQAARELEDRMSPLLASLKEGEWPEGVEQLGPFFYPRLASILEYFPRPPVIVLDDPQRLMEEAKRREKHRVDIFTQMLEGGLALPSQGEAYATAAELENLFTGYQRVYFTLLPRRATLGVRRIIGVGAHSIPAFQGKIKLLVQELSRLRQEQYRIVLMVADPGRIEALQQNLGAEGLETVALQDVSTPPQPGQVVVVPGRLRQGFSWPQMRLAILGDAELYGPVRRPRRHKVVREGLRISSFSDLKEGDYVVHVHHGIGRYLGIQQLEVEGVKKDYLVIQYAGNDRLYVPIDQISLVQKYIGSDGHVPRLYRLGGNEWAKVKGRVQEAVRAMAEELLNLYATRQTIEGHAFSPDTPWQREFEEAFPYTETPDQLKAIAEVKADMEKPKPMDRLLCGDVGYGKTEVALRAAFKAVMDGKQVAVLVPTTVLAQQHYNTFKQRFAPYPIKVAVLSRFLSPKEQAETIAALARGEIDIIIGTHRLLSSDVTFKDLGLVIIDEEQRFGVAHKEKLKQLRYSVDVLTMTATPIPRTLHMALAGVRDMSLIETPPEDRFPVQTYVVEYSPELVREAIRRELERGGQVYYVHNRVSDIEQVAFTLQQLVPEARIAIAHGQMSEEDLERVMLDFIEGHYDVLVCTTIIENGLDIPNVNTLIVDEADNFGLAQLYQLRGRVGRSNRLAYAYFTYRPDKVLGEAAEKRLAAIREFTALGSGYKIALRDLQLRGAGNLLGPEQHGHMLAVGFDLYCQLLEEAVRKIKGQPVPSDTTRPRGAAVELKVDTFLSDNYIPDASLKMEFYQRLLAASSVAEVDEIAAEMIDRFGSPPPAAENLILMARIRLLAGELGITSVQQRSGEVELKFNEQPALKGEKLLELSSFFPRRLSFSSAGGLAIRVRTKGLDSHGLLKLLQELLTRMRELARA